ncbi:nuclear pore complex protein NUP1 isoform X2 [Jatropha curcas]|uniref:nuclear pore complex protein NUP1 isoform X2 n=1 Tax=Jatropha curcas TaxID=180498 RepID=UPI0005FBF4AF|nr:nuclear pore complex protein NUP1 isoform X2 [Jatropha curcas]
MEKKHAETTSYERGAGGKLRKPPRRPPSTPYARPPQNQTQRGGRWLSRLVDPAFRLIAGGANLILPSFFSKSQSVYTLPAPTGQENDHGGETETWHAAVGQNAAAGEDDDKNFTSNHVEPRATEVAGTSSVLDRTIRHSEFNGHEVNKKVDVADPNGLSEIEILMKDKRFSRDEVNRLIELIKSRAVDLPDVEQENKNLSTSGGDLREPAVALEYSGKATGARQEELNRAIWETSQTGDRKHSSAILTDAERPANTLENSIKSKGEKLEDLDRIIWKTSTPLLQSKVQDDVGTSPLEIARAYMENRISDIGFGSDSLIAKDEGTLPCRDDLALKPFVPSPAPKSSPCWPGALVQDQRGYMTPQSQRGRFGLHNFPRTPYSRTIYSKTKSKLIQLQSNTDRQQNTIATPFQQTQTPAFGQVNARGNTLYDGHGSAGPIRRIRHKVNAQTPRGFAYSHTSLNNPQVENFIISDGLFSTSKRNLENGGTNSSAKFQSVGGKQQSSEVITPAVPAHSSLVARKILEHLERNPPTPKDKSAELRLATSWKKPQPSDHTPTMPNKLNSLTHLRSADSSEKSVQVNRNKPLLSPDDVNVVLNNNNSASNINVGTAPTHIGYAEPSQDFKKSQDSQFMNSYKDVSDSKAIPNAADGSSVFNLQKKLPPQTSGTKPVLPSISINKPNQRWTVTSDNSLGFTFPVSASAGVSSEPPTPSILPSSSSIGLNQQNEESSIPSYSFGLKRSTPGLVFSFPSSSTAPINDDTSDLKFNFGSDETKRLSFSSIGQDAICY